MIKSCTISKIWRYKQTNHKTAADILIFQESNAWVEEIIAKIRDILLSFSEQYRANALNGNVFSPLPMQSSVMNVNQHFDYIFDHLSESYAWNIRVMLTCTFRVNYLLEALPSFKK